MPDTKPVTGEVLPAAKVDDLDAAYAEIAREPYLFTWRGRQYVLPHMGELDFRLQAEIETMDEFTIEAIDRLFRRIFGPEQADAFAETTAPASFLTMLFDRWLTHSGAKAGEPEASTPSSESTGVKSRPTSAASTTSASPKLSTGKRTPRKRATPRVKSST